MPLPAAANFRNNAWLVVALLWITACLNYLDRLMITTMRSSLMETIPMTEAQFGLLTTVVLIVYGIGSPFAGYFADKFKRSYVIVGSLLAWSLVTGLTAYVKTYDQLLALRALLALSQVAAVPASVALVVDYHRGSTRSLASGLLLSGAMAGGALSGLGGWIAANSSWGHAHRLFGLIGVAYGIVLLLLLRDPEVTEVPRSTGDSDANPVKLGEAFRSLLTDPGFLLMVVYNCVLGVVAWSVVGWMPTYMKEHFSLTQGAAGMYTTLCANIAALLGLVVGGKWADRWSRRNERARILVPMIGLFLAAPGVLLVIKAPVLALALVGLSLYGFFRYFSDANLMPVLCMLVDPRFRATSWGMCSLFSTMVGGAGIYAGGMLRDAKIDVRHIFEFAAFNLILSAVLMLLIYRYSGKKAAAAAASAVAVPAGAK
jgi:sugar phosphate permease